MAVNERVRAADLIQVGCLAYSETKHSQLCGHKKRPWFPRVLMWKLIQGLVAGLVEQVAETVEVSAA